MNRARFLLSTFLLVAAAGSLAFAGESQPISVGALRGGDDCTAIVLDTGAHAVFGANFDLRCGAPVKMLDIHDGRSGDVADEFVDFDADLNRNHFERFLRIWGVDISSRDITWILNHFDGFPCVQNRRPSPRRVMPVTHR